MKEKIFALLNEKFAGVRKDGLIQLARTLATYITTDEEAAAAVEKLNEAQVNEFVSDYRKDVDKEVSNATKTYENNLKKKFELVQKGAQPKKEEAEPSQQNSSEGANLQDLIKAAVVEVVKPLQDELLTLKGQKLAEARLSALENKFSGVPESYKAQRLADAKLFISNLNDEDFNSYLSKTEADITAFNQELINKGLANQGKPMFSQKDNNGISSGVAAFIQSQDKPALAGKEV